jgi:hypothetical protein
MPALTGVRVQGHFAKLPDCRARCAIVETVIHENH